MKTPISTHLSSIFAEFYFSSENELSNMYIRIKLSKIEQNVNNNNLLFMCNELMIEMQ